MTMRVPEDERSEGKALATVRAGTGVVVESRKLKKK